MNDNVWKLVVDAVGARIRGRGLATVVFDASVFSYVEKANVFEIIMSIDDRQKVFVKDKHIDEIREIFRAALGDEFNIAFKVESRKVEEEPGDFIKYFECKTVFEVRDNVVNVLQTITSPISKPNGQ